MFLPKADVMEWFLEIVDEIKPDIFLTDLPLDKMAAISHDENIFRIPGSWINGWVNNHEAGDSRCHRAHYDAIVMTNDIFKCIIMYEKFCICI